MSLNDLINYDDFRAKLINGLRDFWNEIRQQHPTERFYIFGIATDSDVVVLTPFWNTEEEYEKHSPHDSPTEKWTVPEHGYDDNRHTADLQDLINQPVFGMSSSKSDKEFEKRKTNLLKVFTQALSHLDQEGLFGHGEERHRLLLMVDRGDCDDKEWKWAMKTIKRLNPRKSYGPFFDALKEEKKRQVTLERMKRKGEKPVKAHAINFLNRIGRNYDRCDHAQKVQKITSFLADIMNEKDEIQELWKVCFDANGEPDGRLHGPDVLIVLVNPESGKYVIAP